LNPAGKVVLGITLGHEMCIDGDADGVLVVGVCDGDRVGDSVVGDCDGDAVVGV
jgi:hypothetical protein